MSKSGASSELVVLYCRFCGSDKEIIRHVKNRNDGRVGTLYAVGCTKCYARGPIVKDPDDKDPDKAIAEAIRLWNKETR